MEESNANGVEPKEVMEQVKEENVGVERAFNSPKHSQNKWIQCRTSYERGDFKSVRELGERFGIKEFTLHSRINREGWKEKKEQLLAKVQSTLEKQVVKELTEQESYLKRSYLRQQRYEKIIDASLSQLATTPEGIPMAEPSDIDCLTRSENRIAELSRIALRIPVLSSLDVITGGQSLGESFVQAIAKLRASEAPKLTEEDLQKALEAEVE